MSKTAYVKTALTGGLASCLDGVDGTQLLDGDVATVFAGGAAYTYVLDDDAAGAESSPAKIAPDTNAGDKRWILQHGPNIELIQNGGFDTDAIGWTPTDCTLASVAAGTPGNCLEITRAGGSYQYVSQTVNGLVIGQAYLLSAWIKSGTSGDEAFLIQWPYGAAHYNGQYVSSTTWRQVLHMVRFDETAAQIDLIKLSATPGTMLVDEVSLISLAGH